jgi:hypothetical protein
MSALHGGEWSASCPNHLPLATAPGTHWRGGWLGPRAGLHAVVLLEGVKEKILQGYNSKHVSIKLSIK